MIFNKHSEIEEGAHAVLSPSMHHWLKYDAQRLSEHYYTYWAAERGTRLHAFAKEAIELGINLPRNHQTLNMYVNDAIGFKMTPEQVLYYSRNCFGTADAISFRNNLLRIHDLKTGVHKASFHQLEIYAAIFCLEYGVNPKAITIELRIYQNDEALSYSPDSDTILSVMSTIERFNKQIEEMKMEE